MHFEIYTDGSCLNNGRPDAQAGFGIYWPQANQNSKSGRVVGDVQTSNVGELTAIFYALRQIESLRQQGTTHTFAVYSDSQYAINCLLVWYDKWSRSGWRTSNKKPVKNKDLIITIRNYLDGLLYGGEYVPLVKCQGHQSGREGQNNAMADQLAREGSAGQGTLYFDPIKQTFSTTPPPEPEVTAYVSYTNDGSRWGGCALYYGPNDPRNVYTRTRSPIRGDVVGLIAVDQAMIEILESKRKRPSYVCLDLNLRYMIDPCFGDNEAMEQGMQSMGKRRRVMMRRVRKRIEVFRKAGIRVSFGPVRDDRDRDMMKAAWSNAHNAAWSSIKHGVYNLKG